MTVKLIPVDRDGKKGLDSGAYSDLSTILDTYYTRGYHIEDIIPMPAGFPHPIIVLSDHPVEISGDIGTITADVEVSSEGVSISQIPTVTAGAYSANDAVGGLLTFANAGRESTAGGVIKNIIIIDDAGQDAEMELWLFNQSFTAMSDNAAWAPAEADLENIVAVISTADDTWRDAGTPSVIQVECAIRYDCATTSLFGQLVTRGTPTFAAVDDITVILALLQD